jgi:hypothetical protein
MFYQFFLINFNNSDVSTDIKIFENFITHKKNLKFLKTLQKIY